ncbi:MAG TPA: hypothetical protein VJ866_02125 [Pyrinomonadaceae bacterium]|nr:hypothetical protein [Pyrinomonadaceae bacterium]
MKRVSGGKRGRRWLGALAGLAGLTAGAVGATLLLRRRGGEGASEGGREASPKGRSIYPEYNRRGGDRWARPGMSVTIRAELMPGRSRSERTFRVAEVTPSGRVILEGFNGEHAETEFEPVR